ncbi:MAG: dihydrofolate reductase, partial [Bradyrhizobiaceae bacterium]|nr:dihydrofolate reductase [Bradyrhizobiaceae bacterium]
LPWRLKSDMHHFRALTSGKPVVMGHKTYQSIGRPLPNRTNIVVSRDPAVSIGEVIVTTSVETALAVARGDALRRQADAIMVIGGADLYAQTLARADRLEITRVHVEPPGDVTFPPIRPATWREISRSECTAGPGDEANFTLLTYERIRH